MADTSSLPISAEDNYPRKRIKVLDSEMSYVDEGEGQPIVLLHGNPMSSYLWRNVIPHLSGVGRCLAPDLIGMGDSAVSPTYAYRFRDHAEYLDAWFEAVGATENVILVVHDWGSALGFYRAHRFAGQMAGIAYMDAVVQPSTWAGFNTVEHLFRKIRTVPAGEQMCLDFNLFVEQVIPANVIRQLSPEEMSRYRAPYHTPVSRLPTLVWPRDVPMVEEPNYLNPLVEAYGQWLATSSLPVAFCGGRPRHYSLGRRHGQGVCPDLGQSARGDGQGPALHAGRLAPRDWAGSAAVCARRAGRQGDDYVKRPGKQLRSCLS